MAEVDETTTLLLNNRNTEETNVQQSGSKIIGFFSVIFLTIAFVSIFVYTTQPRKGSKLYKKRFGELTDYLLVKENENKEYNIRDF